MFYKKYKEGEGDDSPSDKEATPCGSDPNKVRRVEESWIKAVEGMGKKLPCVLSLLLYL